MNIPEKLRISGVEYDIVLAHDMMDDSGNAMLGRIWHDKAKIELSAAENLSEEVRGVILWHEIMHGLICNGALKIENEESVVEVLARGVYQVLADNFDRLWPEETSEPTDEEKKND